MPDLEELLKAYGIEDYAKTLKRNRIDIDVLGQLDVDDLKEMGVRLGDRKRFLRLARDMADKKRGHSSDIHLGDDPASDLSFELTSEIRQITVLFVDLVGSTPLAERLAVEDYHAAVATFHECCAAIVKRNGGMPARYIGDALLACFGYPVAAEDDAHRATLAAKEIIEQVPRLKSPNTGPLHARIGVATGVAMTGDLMGAGRESFGPATGAILNLAARLQALAKPNEIYVDQTTRSLTRGAVRFVDLGEQQLKGFADAQKVWRVGKRETATGTPMAIADWRTPLIGRQEELDLLRLRWKTAANKGSFVLITGEAGIGKSRLINEFVDVAGLPTKRVLRMECVPNETFRPLHPIVKLIETLAGTADADSTAEKRKCLKTWVDEELRLSPEVADVLARLFAPVELNSDDDGIDPKARKSRLFNVLVQILEHIGRDGPCLYLLEDMHWIDPTTQELLDHLVERVAHLRALVVCTYRSSDHRPNFIGEARVSLVSLRRLEPDQSAAIVQGVLGNAALSPAVIETIVSRADGVPFFVEELTRSAIEADANRRGSDRDGGQWAQALPITLHGLLLARIDRVPGANRIMPIGAAIGRSFSHKLLIGAAELTEEEALPLLSDLVSSGLLSRRGAGADLEYAFKHALVQDVAYKSMPRGRRSQVHLRIGKVLEGIYLNHRTVQPEILAYHFEAAGDQMKACAYWRLSAAAAQQSSASKEAVAHIQSALRANEKMPEGSGRQDREIELREMLLVPLEVTRWGSQEIAENLERLRVLHRTSGDDDRPLAVLHGLAGYHIIGGRVRLARGLSDEILDWHGPNHRVSRTLGLRLRGFCQFLSAFFEEAIADFEEVKSICKRVDSEEISHYYHADSALVAQCMICWALALQQSQALFDAAAVEAEVLIDRSGSHWDQLYCLHLLASAYQCIGDVTNCQRILSRVMPMAEEAKSDYWIGWGSVLRGWAVAMTSDDDPNVSVIEEGLKRYVSTGSRQLVPYAKTLMADVHLKAGNLLEYDILVEELRDGRDPAEVKYCDVLLERMAAEAARKAPPASR